MEDERKKEVSMSAARRRNRILRDLSRSIPEGAIMTKKQLRKYLLEEDNRLTVRQNGRLDAVEKVLSKMYNTLEKTEYDLLKSFLRIEGMLDEIEQLLSAFQE